MKQIEKTKIKLGYIPLLDCIAILWAKERGFFDEFGLDVELVKEGSWASLRDRLAFGILDAAHCLSAMLPAAHSAHDQVGIPICTPLVLSVNRAYISLSQALSYKLAIEPHDSAQLCAEKIVKFIHAGQNVSLSHVFKHSIHHYCLREWIALADQPLAKQIIFKSLPPPYMVEALASGLIDGFCVGEPWNTQGEIEGLSQIVAASRDIIPEISDKILAVTKEWASRHPQTLTSLTAAILKAQQELQSLTDFKQVWQLLNKFNIVRFPCSPDVHVQKYYAIESIIRNLVKDTSAPQVKDFIWLFEQMQKWDSTDQPLNLDALLVEKLSQDCIQAEIYQEALRLI